MLAVAELHTEHSEHSGSAVVAAAHTVAAAAEPVVAAGWPYRAYRECWQYRPDHSAAEQELELELVVALEHSRFQVTFEVSHCRVVQRHSPSLELELLLVAADIVAVVDIVA